MAKLFKNQEDLLVEFSQFLPDANGGSSSISLNSASNNSSSNSSNSKISIQLQNQTNINELNVFSNFQNQNFQTNQQNSLQNSILNVPIPTVLTSLTTSSIVNMNAGGPSSTASSSSSSAAPKLVTSNLASSSSSSSSTSSSSSKQQPPQQKSSVQPPASASPSAVSSSSSTSSIGSTNTKNKFTSENIQTQQHLQQQQQQLQQPMATINQNSLQCKTNTNPSSNSNLISSVKRSSNYQQISNKKQKLNSNIVNNNTTTANNTNLKLNTNFKSNDSTDVSLNKINGNINEITFFERLKKALRTQQVYDNFLKCLALFNQDIVTHIELIQMVEPFLGKFANLFKWFKEYVETKSIVNVNQDSSTLSPKQFQTDSNLKMSSHMNSSKNRIFMPSGNHYSLEIDYLSCKQYGASYRDISSYPQPISSGQSDLCKQVNSYLRLRKSSFFSH